MIINYADLTKFGEFVSDETTDYDLQIQSAQEIVENYLGYSIEQSPKSKSIDGNGCQALNLGGPIISLTSIMINEAFTPLEEFYLSGEYLFRKGSFFPFGEQNILVSYEGGYEAEKIPALMKLTALRIAAVLVNEGGGAIGVSSVSDPNTGSRTFMERTFKKYLKELDSYRAARW